MQKMFGILKFSTFMIILVIILAIMLKQSANLILPTENPTDNTEQNISDVSSQEFLSIREGTNNDFISKVIYSFIKPLLRERIDYYMREAGIIDKIKNAPFLGKLGKYHDITVGTGPKFYCGQTGLFAIKEIKNDSGNGISYAKPTERLLQIGNTNFLPLDIQNSIIGIQLDGIRVITQEKVYNNVPLSYYIQLKAIQTSFESDVDKVHSFYTTIGVDKAAVCGDTVKLSYTVQNTEMKNIYESELFRNKLGEGELPKIIEAYSVGIQAGGTKTIILPAILLKDTPGYSSLPNNSFALLNITIHTIF